MNYQTILSQRAKSLELRQKVYKALAFFFFGLGVLGAFLPLMPTTVFWIIACGFAFRSSPRLRARMMNHPKFGPGLKAWFEDGSISRRAKIACTVSIIFSFGLTAILSWGSILLLSIIALCLGGINLWIWSRP